MTISFLKKNNKLESSCKNDQENSKITCFKPKQNKMKPSGYHKAKNQVKTWRSILTTIVSAWDYFASVVKILWKSMLMIIETLQKLQRLQDLNNSACHSHGLRLHVQNFSWEHSFDFFMVFLSLSLTNNRWEVFCK